MYETRYREWLEKVKENDYKTELLSLDEAGKKERFHKELSFGTGGLRGEIGVGTARLNVYTVARITAAVAKYIEKENLTKKVAVSYDTRIDSERFAFVAASVFAENGIASVVVTEPMPTPYLSFLTRKENCGVGIMITASHNPSVYNGYKVYGSDGCQITDETAKKISFEAERIGYFGHDTSSYERYIRQGIVSAATSESEKDYLCEIKRAANGASGNLSVVYSPLHGTGRRLIPLALRESGVKSLTLVKEQMTADGNFPTCPVPNPEKAEAFRLALEYAKRERSDIALVSDPDADRIGVAVRANGTYRLLTGNETGALLCEYLLTHRKAEGKTPKNPVVIKTIVTSDLIKKICEFHRVEVQEVLTGFKYIGERVGVLEKIGRKDDFVLGLEESYGYLTGTFVRDKDAVSAACAIAEMAAYYKKQGKTLIDELETLYSRFGRFENKLLTYTYASIDGCERIREIMRKLRERGVKALGGRKVLYAIDYFVDDTGLPKSNVLSFVLEGGGKVLVRPSGTEPLLKAYLFVCGSSEENASAKKALERDLNLLLNNEIGG